MGQKARRYRANVHTDGVKPGTFIAAQRHNGSPNTTIWVEGDDGAEPSLAAVALTPEGVDRLILRLQRIRAGMTEAHRTENACGPQPTGRDPRTQG